jgi:hypothetical protein
MTADALAIIGTSSELWKTVLEGSNLTTETGIVVRGQHNLNDISIVKSDYRTHKSMLTNSVTDSDKLSLSCYVRFSSTHVVISPNSATSLAALADAYYARAAGQISQLRDATDDFGDQVMEVAAIDTAEAILGNLKRANYAPPEISWHGGDAVVMLWTALDMTYAITVTDGEWGYVARRGGKQIRVDDSLKVERFALEYHR